MAPKANALITVAELDLFLQITIGNASLSDLLINMASDFIDRFANRHFIKADYTNQEYDGDGLNNIYLKDYPIVAVTELIEYDSYNATTIYTFTVNTEYLLYLDEGYIFMRGRTTLGHKNYRVTYSAGYLIGDVPYDLKNACAQLAGLIYYNKGKSGIKSEAMGKYSVTYGMGEIKIAGIPVPADIAGVIEQYRRVNI